MGGIIWHLSNENSPASQEKRQIPLCMCECMSACMCVLYVIHYMLRKICIYNKQANNKNKEQFVVDLVKKTFKWQAVERRTKRTSGE